MTDTTKAGFIALIGAPNAGKSTLLNQLIGQQMALTSPKAQATRVNLRGIVTNKDAQFIFVDTPGLHNAAKRTLDKTMVQNAHNALLEADVVVHLIDATKGFTAQDKHIIRLLKEARKPAFLLLNKIDIVKNKEKLLPLMADAQGMGLYKEVIPMSALEGKEANNFLTVLEGYLPESPFLYDPEMVTDSPTAIILAEITREKLFLFLNQELPYTVAVAPVALEDDGEMITVHQHIYLERNAHKQIVLGHKGEMIRRIGTAARAHMQEFMDAKIHLDLQVKVKEKWSEKAHLLRDVGVE